MSPHSAIEWALARGQSIDALRQAIMGNYLSIVALSSALESGSYSKKLLDEVIDRCECSCYTFYTLSSTTSYI
jgi:hypothetical protein